MLMLIYRIIRFIVITVLLIVITQDFQIFPRALISLPYKIIPKKVPVPSDVIPFRVLTADRKELVVWHLAPRNKGVGDGLNVIIFHGNGDTVENFYFIQEWFAKIGFNTFSFDYRGFGLSSGWPSERGLYLDSQAVWEAAVARSGSKPENTVLFGFSLGAAPAAELAAKIQPKLLVLFGPFSELANVVRRNFVFRYFVPLLWYKFPVADYVAQLQKTKLIVAHGGLDNIIPVAEGEQVFRSYKGAGGSTMLTSPVASHNDLFPHIEERFEEALKEQLY